METKHIAMWTCPRSRSTAITRAFEQINDCLIYDEPLHHVAYFNYSVDYDNGIKDFPSDYLAKYPDPNYQNIIKKITGDLPEGKSFSFQKHMSYHLLPGFDRSWLTQVKNFFLIRNPQETIFSYWKARQAGGFNWSDSASFIGWEEHYQLFKEFESLTQAKPLIIDSGDVIKNPRSFLQALCNQLGVEFSENMLSWEANKTEVLSWENSIYEQFSKKVLNSTGFFQESKQDDIPDLLWPCINKCMPYYEEMSQHKLKIREIV